MIQIRNLKQNRLGHLVLEFETYLKFRVSLPPDLLLDCLRAPESFF